MTSQPKDMEQLKFKARSLGISLDGFEYKLLEIPTVDKLIKEAHRSGRESMRDECADMVGGWVKEDKKMPSYMKSAIHGLLTAIASALKKIKL